MTSCFHRRVQTADGVFPDMGNKLYNEHELTDDWARARDASIQYGELRNHRASTKKNDRRGSLWVACDFMDMGVMSAETIQDTDWLVSGINSEERFLAHRSSLQSDLVLEDERCPMDPMAIHQTLFFDSR